MRGILYGLFGVSEEDEDKWMTEKSWRGILIDLILIYGGGIILGVIIIKILLRFRVDMDIKMLKYAMIIILNLVVFGIYYGMHRELVDEYVGDIFDSVFESEVGKRPEVPVFSAVGNAEEKRDKLKKKVGMLKKPSWWKGVTLFMGEKPMVNI